MKFVPTPRGVSSSSSSLVGGFFAEDVFGGFGYGSAGGSGANNSNYFRENTNSSSSTSSSSSSFFLGTVRLARRPSDYCPQRPWLSSATVRENVVLVGGREKWDEGVYLRALRAAALDADVAAWPLGGSTWAGDRGSALSGGQRARVALARALYSVLLPQEEEEKKREREGSNSTSPSSSFSSSSLPPPIVLLDDPTSALDASVAAAVVERALAGGRRSVLRCATRVVATHSPLVVGREDVVVRMERGRVVSVGPPTAAERARAEAAAEAARSTSAAAAAEGSSAASSAALSTASSCSSSLAGGAAGAGGGGALRPRCSAAADSQQDGGGCAEKPDGDASDGEVRSVGAVAWPVYRRYLQAAGPWMVFLAVSSLVLMQATRNGADVWLAAWVSSEDASEARARAAAENHEVENAFSSSSSSSSPPSSSSSPSLLSSSSLFPFSTRLRLLSPSLASETAAAMPESTRFYLAGLVVIAAANSAFALARAFSYALACLAACRRLHDQALLAVLAAPLSFFSSQPAGRLLNRFSADVTVADDDLPFVANVALASTAGLVGAACVMAGAQPVLLPCALFPLWFVYDKLRVRYSASARELRRLAAVAKSPVVTGVADALGGGATLRSLPGAAAAAARGHARALAGAQRAALSSAAASQWLALRLQLIAAVVAGAAGVAAVVAHTGAKAKGDFSSSAHGPGAVGLSLAYALPLTSLLGGALTAGAEAEQELVSVERLREYCELEPQPQRLPPHPARVAVGGAGEAGAASSSRGPPPPPPNANKRSQRSPPLPPPPPASWPERGGVAFEDVWLRYVPRGPWALAGLTLSVPAGTSLGVAGRTGAGKSTLIAALLRLAETSAGGVRVDGHDFRCVPLRRLRAAVALVPQQPFVFRGTVRDNLDPLGQRSDVEMVSALKAARLWDVLAGLALAQRKASGAFSGGGAGGFGGVNSSPRRNGGGGVFSADEEGCSDASDCEGGEGGRGASLGSRGR